MQQKQQRSQSIDAQDFFEKAQIQINSNELDSLEITINHQDGLPIVQTKKPYDLIPRFINNVKYKLKKQPLELTAAKFNTINKQAPDTEGKKSKKNILNKIKDRKLTLHQKFFLSNAYRLIYSKMQSKKQFHEYVNNFASNYIYLGEIFDYNPNQYTCLLSAPEKERQHAETNHLKFDSNFECGNLLYVFKHIESPTYQYQLILQNDTNTRGYTQWFYFSIQNIQKNTLYKFKIVNFMKKHSLFEEGMKPWILLKQNSEWIWKQDGINISYQKTKIRREKQDSKFYYQLSFELMFQEKKDIVYIATTPPYSYTKLVQSLRNFEMQSKLDSKIHFEINIVAHSLSSNGIPMVKITNNNTKKKSIIGIVARQHPGQTWSSYLMQGILSKLIQNSEYSNNLRQNFQFVIIPMINVDGVIFGNFRCDLNGQDINRKWTKPNRIFDNSLHRIKGIFENIIKTQKIQFFLDLHGHSRKFNTFCYSCITDQVSCRVLPLILDKLEPIFHFPDCTFNLDHSKVNTLRGMIFNQINDFKVMTIQCSFLGSNKGGTITHFTPQIMFRFSDNILKALDIYLLNKKHQGINRKNIEQYVKMNLSFLQSYINFQEVDVGSDSEPQQFELTKEERLQNVLPKKINNFKIERKKVKWINKKSRNSMPIKNEKIQKSKAQLMKQTNERKQKNQTQTLSAVRRPKPQNSFNNLKTQEYSDIQLKQSIIQKKFPTPKNIAKPLELRATTKQLINCGYINIGAPYFSQKRNQSQQKKLIHKSINNHIDVEIDSLLFNEYLLRKTRLNRLNEQSKLTMEKSEQSKNLQTSKYIDQKSIKGLMLISQKKKQEILFHRRKNQSYSYVRSQSKPEKKEHKFIDSIKNFIGKKKDPGMLQLSSIWKINMQRYGMDGKQMQQS